jgi:hypothetical protein
MFDHDEPGLSIYVRCSVCDAELNFSSPRLGVISVAPCGTCKCRQETFFKPTGRTLKELMDEAPIDKPVHRGKDYSASFIFEITQEEKERHEAFVEYGKKCDEAMRRTIAEAVLEFYDKYGKKAESTTSFFRAPTSGKT